MEPIERYHAFDFDIKDILGIMMIAMLLITYFHFILDPTKNPNPDIDIIISEENKVYQSTINEIKDIIYSEDPDNLLNIELEGVYYQPVEQSVLRYTQKEKKSKDCVIFENGKIRKKEIQQFIREIYKSNGYCIDQCK